MVRKWPSVCTRSPLRPGTVVGRLISCKRQFVMAGDSASLPRVVSVAECSSQSLLRMLKSPSTVISASESVARVWLIETLIYLSPNALHVDTLLFLGSLLFRYGFVTS